jgi:NADH-quinone oxidoreductase subunit G
VLHTAAARVGGLDLGFVPGPGGRDVAGILEGAATGAIDFVYLLGADEIDTSKLGKAFVVYQGHHGDRGAHRADVILPGAAYTEKHAIYVNTEGRPQHTHRAVFPPGDAREDWRILRALSEVLGKKLPYDTVEAVRAGMAEANPVFAKMDRIVPATWGAFGTAGQISDAPLASPIANFYQTDPISRASPTMAKCTALHMSGVERTGTHG